jgi:predicted unusual protein kinase regulating ubiquinone biosynthesis (AarF/ABC1/UbiB family)
MLVLMEKRRYRQIVFFFARLIINFAFWDLIVAKIGLRKLVAGSRSSRYRMSARAFRQLAVRMGGVLIKVGQFLSSRVDILPQEITSELEGLQDEVPPENFAAIKRLAEEELGKPMEEVFQSFDEIPLAAASLGQVHKAIIRNDQFLQSGSVSDREDGSIRDVVVKIQRPRIETLIATDLAAIRTVGKWLMRYRPIRTRADISSLIDEFSDILYEEIDYLHEGRNAEIFAKNFAQDPGVRVPEVIWSQTTRRVLTLENVWSIKINDYTAIDQAGIDRKEVAARLLNTYLKQIFEDGFFHADPHPGNLFIFPLPVEKQQNDSDETYTRPVTDWQLTFVDFGMTGKVSQNIMDGLREMLIAVGTKDATRLVRSYKSLGFLLPSADLELLEKVEAKAFERFWGKTMSELQHMDLHEMREFASEFRELIYTMPFQIPHHVIFLARAVGILSGMCTGLDPDFNVWLHLSPYAQNLISRSAGGKFNIIVDEVKRWVQLLYGMPVQVDTMISKLNRGELIVQAPQISQAIARLERDVQRLVIGFIFVGLLIGGVLLVTSGWSTLGLILMGLSLVCVILIIFHSR